MKVKVLEVDAKRKRIALTMRLTDTAPKADARETQRPATARIQPKTENLKPAVPNAMAAAFSKLIK